MSSISGRFSKFPAIDRSVPRSLRLDEAELHLAYSPEDLSDPTPWAVVAENPITGDLVARVRTQVEAEKIIGDQLVVPDVNAADLLKWAGSNKKRRAAALEAEKAGRKRKGVLKALDPNYVAPKNQVPLL